jgi:hypothetical protein
MVGRRDGGEEMPGVSELAPWQFLATTLESPKLHLLNVRRLSQDLS